MESSLSCQQDSHTTARSDKKKWQEDQALDRQNSFNEKQPSLRMSDRSIPVNPEVTTGP